MIWKNRLYFKTKTWKNKEVIRLSLLRTGSKCCLSWQFLFSMVGAWSLPETETQRLENCCLRRRVKCYQLGPELKKWCLFYRDISVLMHKTRIQWTLLAWHQEQISTLHHWELLLIFRNYFKSYTEIDPERAYFS